MSPGPSPAPRAARVVLAAALGGVWLLHAAVHEPSEPFFNNDETRHVMTGVFFRDSLVEGGLLHPREYAESYFLKYPALGLLVWPPFFHAVEGVWFLLTGPSFLAARVLVGLHATIACLYLFLLASRTHGPARAAFAAVLFALAPQTFVYSRQVMLEMPTLTCSLAAFYHFARFVESERRRHILLCAVFSSLAALTRFDGFFLFPACGLFLLGSRRLDLLLRREVLLSGLLFAVLVVPYYAYMAYEVGWYQWKAISEGTTPASTGLFHAKNFWYYLAALPRQLGPFVVPFALAGLGRGLLPGRLRASLPYMALVAGTYLMVVPVAEIEARHTIYWVPAFALFAAE
ncbi:MAG: glycosyltransferase family 39 protein, partial [Planctomycetes bacterium]|nr:glycosyltransferase family 39 protein [Planctomycetota bacterium]